MRISWLWARLACVLCQKIKSFNLALAVLGSSTPLLFRRSVLLLILCVKGHMFIQVFTRVCVCAYVEAKGSCQVSSSVTMYLTFSFWTQRSLIQLGWMASELQGFPFLCLPSTGIMSQNCHASLFVWMLGISRSLFYCCHCFVWDRVSFWSPVWPWVNK